MATSSAKLKVPSGPSRHVYDVIVIGSQLGGALAAALLAKRSHRVLLVEHDGMGPGYEHGGYVLPYAPFVAPPLKTMPTVEEALTELGLTATVQRALRPHVPELQLLLPKSRLDLHADTARRKAEAARELGEEGEVLLGALAGAAVQHEGSDAFLKAAPPLPPDGFFEGWNLKKLIKAHPGLEATPRLAGDSAPVRLVRGLLPFVSHLENPESPLSQTRPLSQVLSSPSCFSGGREGLRELLSRRVVELGGDVLGRDSPSGFIVEELTFDGSKFAGMKLLRSDTVYRAACLVAATDAGGLRRLVTDKKHHRGLLEHLDQSSTKSLLFTVNWVVPESALPRGLGELALVDTGDPELGPLLVQVHLARSAPGPGGKEGKEVEGLRVVCAGVFVPASYRDLGEEHLQGVASRIDEHLDTLMPFTAQHRLLRSAPYLDAGGVRGSRLMPHPLYSFESEAFLGVTGLTQRTPAKNILLASREVLPGLGLEGELLVGIRAARMVQDMLKKKDPLKG